MHAADAVAMLQRARDRGDADRRGVGGEDAVGRDDGLELAEQLLLDLEILEHRLDDDMAGLEVVELVGDRRDWHRSWRGRRRSAGPWPPGPSASRGSPAFALAAPPAAASNMIALMPPCAVTCAMPRPMAPVPTTPTVRSERLMSRIRHVLYFFVFAALRGADRKGRPASENPFCLRASSASSLSSKARALRRLPRAAISRNCTSASCAAKVAVATTSISLLMLTPRVRAKSRRRSWVSSGIRMVQLPASQIPDIVRDDRCSAASYSKLEKVIVTFVPQVRPPQVVNAYPSPYRRQRLNQCHGLIVRHRG